MTHDSPEQPTAQDISQVLRSIADNAQDILYRYSFSPVRGYQYVSPSAHTVTGYSVAEHFADPDLPFKVLHPDDVAFFRVREKQGTGGQPIIVRWIRKDGRIIWVEHRNNTIEDADGNVIAIQGVARDVTALHRAQAERELLVEVGSVLAQSLELDTTIAHLAREVTRDFASFCIIDIELGDAFAPVFATSFVNPSHKALWDQQFAAIGHKHLRPTPIAAAMQTRKPILLASLSAADYPEMSECKEQLVLWNSLQQRSMLVAPLVARDRMLGAISLFQCDAARPYDAQDLRLAVELARRLSFSVDNALQYRATQDATAARDVVLAVVAHDLRSPLTAAQLAVNKIEKCLQREGPLDTIRAAVEVINRSINRSDRLIQDLLDLAQIEAGQLHVSAAPEHVERLVLQAKGELESLLRQAEVSLTIVVAPKLPKVVADANRVAQIFANLVGNAAKFTAAGGAVEISAKLHEEGVVICVSDTGCGVDAESLAHLFDRFWQARKKDRRGVGLGLSVVKGLVEAHGGRIWVESKVARGTSFFFTLPALPS